MSKKRLVLVAEDDGQHVTLKIERYDEVAGVEIGPIQVYDDAILSFPSPVVEEWMRDMAVLFAERL
jgi:hypothetical protein